MRCSADIVCRSLALSLVRFAVLVVPCAVAGNAAAQVDCGTLTNPVYFPATTDIRPALSLLAPALSATTAGADQMTIVYRSLSSCNATDYLRDGTDLTGSAIYWTLDANGDPVENACDVPAGTKPSVAASDITWQTCYGEAAPATIRQWRSYVQTFLFVAPKNSTQNAITAEEAYFVLKFGGEADRQVPPWTNPDFVMIRSPASSTQLVLGLAAGIPGTMWSPHLMNSSSGSGGVVNKVKAENTTGNAEATIGILSTQRFDRERDNIKALAFQSFDQCLGGFYPDSTTASFDKANVRDGHYSAWANLQLMAKVDGGGTPTDANAARLIEVLTSARAVPGVNAIEAAIKAGAVPECAMRVQREFDGGPLSSFAPTEPCHCYFDTTVAGGNTSCTPCTDDNICGAGKCRYGYCEDR